MGLVHKIARDSSFEIQRVLRSGRNLGYMESREISKTLRMTTSKTTELAIRGAKMEELFENWRVSGEERSGCEDEMPPESDRRRLVDESQL
jgi:hypothetical protein